MIALIKCNTKAWYKYYSAVQYYYRCLVKTIENVYATCYLSRACYWSSYKG